jgi:uncharacterized protein YukE
MGDGPGDGKVLDIKTADLKASAPTFGEQSRELKEALTALTTALDGLGSPWGDDDQGKAFAALYKPAHTKIENSTKILITGLASIHDAMADMADGHVDNETLVAAMFTKKGVKGADAGHGSDKTPK